MKFTRLRIPDLILVQPHLHQDQRGYFFESFHQLKFSTYLNQTINFVQDNQSFSKKNVLRGLHLQLKFPQEKYISVIKGKILDVVVDLRKDSIKLLTSKRLSKFPASYQLNPLVKI